MYFVLHVRLPLDHCRYARSDSSLQPPQRDQPQHEVETCHRTACEPHVPSCGKPSTVATVRPVRIEEWEALRDVRLRALADAPQMFGTTLSEAERRTDAEWQDAARRGASGDRWLTFVADDGGRLIGMVSGVLDEHGVVDLIQMWVEPAARRAGVGTRLGQAVLRWAIERDSPVARLGVNASEPGAIALYRFLGFRDTGRREPLFPGHDVQAMEMEAPVAPPDRSGSRVVGSDIE